MINLRHVEVFYAIMRAGSVTEAARVLNVTQPAVSIALKQLEARLKMKLFDRAGGRLQPTPEARALLPDVAEIFGRLGAVERFSQDLASGMRGVLSMAATHPLCDGVVAKAVASFLVKRPNVRVNLQAVSSPVVLDRVINREIDFGVVFEPVVSAAVRSEELMRVPIGCVMPVKHPLAKRSAIRVRDLEPYPLITYLPQARLRPHIDRAFSEKQSAMKVVVETGTSATAVSLAVAGAGIALVELSLFHARPVAGFTTRPLEPKVEVRALLLRPRQGATSKVLEDFIEHMRASTP